MCLMAASLELVVSDVPFEVQRVIHPQDSQHREEEFGTLQGGKDPHSATEVSAFSKDTCRRKRVNRATRLKQCKLDARREQWLAQGKMAKSDQQQRAKESAGGNLDVKGIAMETPSFALSTGNTSSDELTSFTSVTGNRPRDGKKVDTTNVAEHEIRFCMDTPGDKDDKSKIWSSSILGSEDVGATAGKLDPAVVWTASFPTSAAYGNKRNGSRRDFFKGDEWSFRGGEGDSVERITRDSSPRSIGDSSTGSSSTLSVSRPRSGSSFSTSRSGSSRSNSSFGESSSEEEDDGHHVEDDWEAAADALHVQASLQHTHELIKNPVLSDCLKSPQGDEPSLKKTMGLSSSDYQSGVLKPEYKCKAGHFGAKMRVMGRAWRPDDISRPSTLPRLAKQHSFPIHSGKPAWGAVNGGVWGSPPAPAYCPICTEELDVTDSSFVPCACGFRLCLFCHHKISLDDGRCPGCRKLYNSDVALKLSRSSTIRPRA